MISFYPWIKSLHVGTVIFTGTFFLVRLIWMYRGSPRLHERWVGILPHVNDTLLLASGITMAVLLQQYPLAQPWLTAKLGALLFYIVLGSIGLKRGRTRRERLVAGLLALACLFYIIGVALTRSPTL